MRRGRSLAAIGRLAPREFEPGPLGRGEWWDPEEEQRQEEEQRLEVVQHLEEEQRQEEERHLVVERPQEAEQLHPELVRPQLPLRPS